VVDLLVGLERAEGVGLEVVACPDDVELGAVGMRLTEAMALEHKLY